MARGVSSVGAIGALGVAVLVGGMGASRAEAALVSYEFEANVSFLIAGGLPPAYAGVQNGDRFTMSFSVDTSVADSEWRNWWGVYPGAIKDVTLAVPRLGVVQNYGDTALQTYDGRTQYQQDEFRFDLGIGEGATVIFWLRSGSPDGVSGPSVRTNDAIPSDLDVTEWNYTRTMGLYHNAGGPGNYTIFSGSPTPTPEPASLALLGLGVVTMAARRRLA